jgi:hypothetical protein
MTNNKAVTIVLGAVGAMIVMSLIVRFVVLSQYGVSSGWMFYAVPFGGIGVVVLLLRLGLLNLGDRSGGGAPAWRHDFGTQAYPPAPQPAPGVSHRLQELENMRADGAISETEYSAKRQQIIATI